MLNYDLKFVSRRAQIAIIICIVCESEPVSDRTYLQIQAQAKRHLINYLCVHTINVNMSVVLIIFMEIPELQTPTVY